MKSCKSEEIPDKGRASAKRKKPAIASPGIGAERAEENDFEEAKKHDELPVHYRTKVDEY